jgi:uncharacterized protein (TIGR03032 family)
MGLAVRDGELALGTRCQVWLFRDAPDIAAQLGPPHDACYIPRVSYVTGDIRGHEIAWVGGELWIVNTLFSCLCTVDPRYSFVPRWHPAFLAGPAPGDHCHLNGLAVSGGNARYVTALGATDTPGGWRPTKADGGVLIDVPTREIVSRGMCMPHSPRLHQGKLWLLESGTGRLHIVDEKAGSRTPVAQLPGFVRGLAFAGPYAFIGLSKIRESATFGNLPIAAKPADLQCGIWVVDVAKGTVVEFMQFEAGVEEIFAVEVLAGCRYPEILGFQQETIRGAFVVPRGETQTSEVFRDFGSLPDRESRPHDR